MRQALLFFLLSIFLFPLEGFAQPPINYIDVRAPLRGGDYVGETIRLNSVRTNVRHGKGKMVWSNGSSYDGEWYEGLMHGKGVFTSKDGDRYEGDFKHDSADGVGTMSWMDGRHYQGEISRNIIEGKGTFKYPNGDVYQGYMKNGRKHGPGTLTLANGNVITGTWKKDKADNVTEHQPKYASLAVDRNNGFYYGWAHDYDTREEAEQRALEECKKRGGNCSTVLTYTGTGVGVYRTIPGHAGTAYGWGVSSSFPLADSRATEECLKRSESIACTNFVYASNSETPQTPLNILYEAPRDETPGPEAPAEPEAPEAPTTEPEAPVPEVPTTPTPAPTPEPTPEPSPGPSESGCKDVVIGKQTWSCENLKATTFRNGDAIAEAKNTQEWFNYLNNKIPAFWRSPIEEYGFYYNRLALTDPRGLAPEGWKVPSVEDFKALCFKSSCQGPLRSRTHWRNGTGIDSYGFNAFPAGSISMGQISGTEILASFATTDVNERKQPIVYILRFDDDDFRMIYSSHYTPDGGHTVRLIKE